MKGAIGSAFILNLVITFIFLFFGLLIGSMAYSKAYKVKNYILNTLVMYDNENGQLPDNETARENSGWNSMVNGYLAKVGYHISTSANTCPLKGDHHPDNAYYKIVRNTTVGSYDYCVYIREYSLGRDSLAIDKYTYKVITYMKFDFPVMGSFFKIPLTGESKVITKYE